MLVDAHVHVWRAVSDHPQPALTTVSPVSDVPLELLDAHMTEYGVERAVLVQPLYPGQDNSYIADCAASRPERYASVCVVDPTTPDAADRLEYWVRRRGCKGLRLRPRVPMEAAVFGAAASFPLWERARALRVVINVLCSPEHLSVVAELAERFPDVPILLDHMAYPNLTERTQSLIELSRYPHVYVKVSGHYYFCRQPYPFDDCRDLFRALYDHYSAARLIWGSDFPHVLLKLGYRRSLLLHERTFPFLTPFELELIMGGNAARLYWS